MLSNLIYLILAFFITFFITQIIHEFIHKWLAERQGAKAKIDIWFWHIIPSMSCSITGGSVNDLFYAAGILNGICLLFISIPLSYIWQLGFIVCFVNGAIQLFYGIYELLFIHKLPQDKYMKYHYYIYLGTAIISSVLIYKSILSYLGV